MLTTITECFGSGPGFCELFLLANNTELLLYLSEQLSTPHETFVL